MINRIWNFYVLVNYTGQRVTGSFFTEKSVINAIMFEISFVASVIPFALIRVFEVRNPWIGAIISFIYVMLLWVFFKSRIKKNIDFGSCEGYYLSLGREMKVIYFITTIMLLILTFLFMIISIKLIL